MKRLLGLLVLALSCGAYAQICTKYKVGAPGYSTTVYVATKVAACQGYLTWLNANGASSCTSGGVVGSVNRSIGQVESYCGINTQCSSGGGINVDANTGGYQTTQADCSPVCEAGIESTKNVTLGYSGTEVPEGGTGRADFKSDGSPNPSGQWTPPKTLCSGGCVQTVTGGGDFWSSKQPTAAGMYRVSRDYTMSSTATTCTPTSADSDSLDGFKAAPASCPGSQGYVNGRPACIPQTATPPPADPPAQTTTGNPTAGSSPTTPDRIPPVNGDGGNKGGPPHPADGTIFRGDGTTLTTGTSTTATGTKAAVVGEEQQACGAPGQPKCRIDESGTPNGSGLDAALKTALDDLQTGQANAINGAGQKALPGWTWSFAMPTGCSAFSMGDFNLTVDVCAWQSMIHDLMSLIWLSTVIWACVGMVGRTVRGGV